MGVRESAVIIVANCAIYKCGVLLVNSHVFLDQVGSFSRFEYVSAMLHLLRLL